MYNVIHRIFLGVVDVVYFNASKLGVPDCEYVLWLDCMGIKSSMSRSIDVSANFIGKFHSALSVYCDICSVFAYPVMDGAYLTAPNKRDITRFIAKFLKEMTQEFINETDSSHQFLVRGALAYGQVQHGHKISIDAFCPPKSAPDRKEKMLEHKKTLIFGLPVIQAFTSENYAPPFGIYIHETARTFSAASEKPISAVWYNWFKNNAIQFREENGVQLRKSMQAYFGYCQNHTYETGYSDEKIKQHREMFKQFIDTCVPEQAFTSL